MTATHHQVANTTKDVHRSLLHLIGPSSDTPRSAQQTSLGREHARGWENARKALPPARNDGHARPRATPLMSEPLSMSVRWSRFAFTTSNLVCSLITCGLSPQNVAPLFVPSSSPHSEPSAESEEV